MDYYSYSYPARVKTETKKIRHIVDTTPENINLLIIQEL